MALIAVQNVEEYHRTKQKKCPNCGVDIKTIKRLLQTEVQNTSDNSASVQIKQKSVNFVSIGGEGKNENISVVDADQKRSNSEIALESKNMKKTQKQKPFTRRQCFFSLSWSANKGKSTVNQLY